MVKQDLKKIFLSASIPSPVRGRKFYSTADIIAIRDAVRALASVVIPYSHLIWGGHPSITPLIRYVLETVNAQAREHVTLYQSEFFAPIFPPENAYFERMQVITKAHDRDSSLFKMREEMIAGHNFAAGVFIGGMEGVLAEYELFVATNSKAIILPVASTGAASKIIFERLPQVYNERLQSDYAYMALFKDLLGSILNH